MTKSQGSESYTLDAKDTKNIETHEIPKIVHLMQSSVVMNAVYRYGIRAISNIVAEQKFMKNSTNVKYITLGACLLIGSALIGMLSYFLFYILFFFSSLKCILWLFEQYNPDTSSRDTVNSYETSASDVLEYFIVPIFIVLVIHPLAYIPVPFLPLVVYSISVLISMACIINRSYRRKFCLFVRDVFTSKNSRDNSGMFIRGNEGEFHKFLRTIIYTIECITLCTFNIAHNPLTIYNKLSSTSSFTNAMQTILQGDTQTDESMIDELDTESSTYDSELDDELDEEL